MIQPIDAGRKIKIELYYYDGTVDTVSTRYYDETIIQFEIRLDDNRKLIVPKTSLKKAINI